QPLWREPWYALRPSRYARQIRTIPRLLHLQSYRHVPLHATTSQQRRTFARLLYAAGKSWDSPYFVEKPPGVLKNTAGQPERNGDGTAAQQLRIRGPSGLRPRRFVRRGSAITAAAYADVRPHLRDRGKG